eukprot:GHVH01003930.1.p1 GENE.GHVH01003930.1~~GHVH01003930.1.p1  ORF type:complete len:1425 (-),score=198.86 GHVH01003930.1:193-4467(-)
MSEDGHHRLKENEDHSGGKFDELLSSSSHNEQITDLTRAMISSKLGSDSFSSERFHTPGQSDAINVFAPAMGTPSIMMLGTALEDCPMNELDDDTIRHFSASVTQQFDSLFDDSNMPKTDKTDVCDKFMGMIVSNINAELRRNKVGGKVVAHSDYSLTWVPELDSANIPPDITEYLFQVNDVLSKLNPHNSHEQLKILTVKQPSTSKPDAMVGKSLHAAFTETGDHPHRVLLEPNALVDGNNVKSMNLSRHHLSTAVIKVLEDHHPGNPILNNYDDSTSHELRSGNSITQPLWDSSSSIDGFKRELHGDPVLAVALSRSGSRDHLTTIKFIASRSDVEINGLTGAFFNAEDLVLPEPQESLSFERPNFMNPNPTFDLKSILPYLPCFGIDMNSETSVFSILPWITPTASGVPLFGSTHLLPLYFKCTCDENCNWQIMFITRLASWHLMDCFVRYYFQKRSITFCGKPLEEQLPIAEALMRNLLREVNSTKRTPLESIPYHMRALLPIVAHPFYKKPKLFFKLLMSMILGLNIMIFSEQAASVSAFVMSLSAAIPLSASGMILSDQTEIKDLLDDNRGAIGRLQLTDIIKDRLCIPNFPLALKSALLNWLKGKSLVRSYLIGCSHPLLLAPDILKPDLIFNADTLTFLYDRSHEGDPHIKKLLTQILPSGGSDCGSIGARGKDLSSYQQKYIKNSLAYANCTVDMLDKIGSGEESELSELVKTPRSGVIARMIWGSRTSKLTALPEGYVVAPVSLPETSAYFATAPSHSNNVLHFAQIPGGLPMLPAPQLASQIDGYSLYGEIDCLEGLLRSMGYQMSIMTKATGEPVHLMAIDKVKADRLLKEWHMASSTESHQLNIASIVSFRYVELLLRLIAIIVNSNYLLGGNIEDMVYRLSSSNNLWIKEFGGEEFIREILHDQKYSDWRRNQRLPIVLSFTSVPSPNSALWACVRYPNGDIHTGFYRGGLRYGYGVYSRIRSGERGTSYYNGMWKSDKRHGRGEHIIQGLLFYEGFWKNDKCHGGANQIAVRILKDGADIYHGEFADGMWNGTGVHLDGQGVLYRGAFAQAMKEGSGQLRYPSGLVVLGSFRSNERCGDCIVIHNKLQFEGVYDNGVLNGKGLVILYGDETVKTIRAKLTGFWNKGVMHGPGRLEIFNDSESRILDCIGQWKDGIINDKYSDWNIIWPGGEYTGAIKFVSPRDHRKGVSLGTTGLKFHDYRHELPTRPGTHQEGDDDLVDLFNNSMREILLFGSEPVALLEQNSDIDSYDKSKITVVFSAEATGESRSVTATHLAHLPVFVPHGHGKLTNTQDNVTCKGQFFLGIMHKSSHVSSDLHHWSYKGDYAWGLPHGNGTIINNEQTGQSRALSALFREGEFYMTKSDRVLKDSSLPHQNEVHPAHWRFLSPFKKYDPGALAAEMINVIAGGRM